MLFRGAVPASRGPPKASNSVLATAAIRAWMACADLGRETWETKGTLVMSAMSSIEVYLGMVMT